MKTEAKLDTLEPKYIPEAEDGPLTQVPNSDRFEPSTKAGKAIADTKEKLKEQGSEIKHRAIESAKSRADGYVSQTSSHIRNLENVTKAARDQLDDDQPEYIKKGIDLATNKVGQVADYFETKDSAQIADDAKQFVRKHPAVVLGGLALAGFLAGRFVKATHSDEIEYEES